MARKPTGAVPFAQSSTGLFAFIAARLAGHSDLSAGPFLRGLGLKITAAGSRRAATPYLEVSPHKKKRGPARAAAVAVPRRPAIREWLLVDESKLGLEKALVRFPGNGLARPELRRALERLAAVRQVLELEYDRELVAIVVFADAEARAALQAQLAELTTDARIWDGIIHETHLPARRLWSELARRAAAGEDLLEPTRERKHARG
jgi:hypothetical protein